MSLLKFKTIVFDMNHSIDELNSELDTIEERFSKNQKSQPEL